MDKDARRYKNASKADAAFKEGQGIILNQEENQEGEKKGNQKLGQGQQQRGTEGQSLRSSPAGVWFELLLQLGFSKHQKEPFHKAMEQKQEKIEEQ